MLSLCYGCKPWVLEKSVTQEPVRQGASRYTSTHVILYLHRGGEIMDASLYLCGLVLLLGLGNIAGNLSGLNVEVCLKLIMDVFLILKFRWKINVMLCYIVTILCVFVTGVVDIS